jgi:hypothetical protein
MTEQAKNPGKKTCPQCGKPASGNFCQHCGSTLGSRSCTECGAELSGAAKFCTQCGAPAVKAGGRGASRRAGPGASAGVANHRQAAAATLGGGNAPWWIAGIAMFGLILVVGWNAVKPGPRQAPGAAPAGMPGAAGDPAAGMSTIDLNSMTPREAADRLFNRVMAAMSQADTSGGMFFQPMAVQAYERAEPLDLDGLLHLSLLQSLADPSAGLATAQRILESEPDHVLGLGAAAQAALALGDSAQATTYYKHLLEVYDAQFGRNLVEYDGHRSLMAEMRDDARQFLAGG